MTMTKTNGDGGARLLQDCCESVARCDLLTG